MNLIKTGLRDHVASPALLSYDIRPFRETTGRPIEDVRCDDLSLGERQLDPSDPGRLPDTVDGVLVRALESIDHDRLILDGAAQKARQLCVGDQAV